MALYIGSLVVFLMVSVALGLSLLTRGQVLKIGCGRVGENPDCERSSGRASTCGGLCRREIP